MQILHPVSEKTIGNLCDYVATRATSPVVRPIDIGGSQCLAAGAFLALRKVLRDAGEDVTDLHPSSPLGPTLARRLGPFGQIRHPAPDHVPSPRVEHSVRDCLALARLVCHLIFLL